MERAGIKDVWLVYDIEDWLGNRSVWNRLSWSIKYVIQHINIQVFFL
jgi:hypothetical protein